MTSPDRGASGGEPISRLTPARLRLGRTGTAYPSRVALQLRADHATARDAVFSEFTPFDGSLARVTASLNPIELHTSVRDRREYLLRPDLGRRLNEESKQMLAANTDPAVSLQIAIGDGLSPTAIRRHAAPVLEALVAGATERRWQCGPLLVIHGCRVGILNDLGATRADVYVLLIGERPGMATADSMSAYLAWRPQPGDNDSHRNLISNIHDRGVSAEDAAGRILGLADAMHQSGTSGVGVKEQLSDRFGQRLPSGE